MANKDLSKLSELVKNARKTEPTVQRELLIFWGESLDRSYVPHTKSCFGNNLVHARLGKTETLSELQVYCSKKKCNRVVSTSISLLKLLLQWDKRAAPKLTNYAGSYFKIPALNRKDEDIEIVFTLPLKQLVTVSYGKFMFRRYVTKLTSPDTWYQSTEFSWELLTPENEAAKFRIFSECFLVSIDIETFKENAAIRSVQFAGFRKEINGELLESECVVLPIDSEYNLAILRKWCWQLKAPKVFQNGRYDISYLCRYNSPVYNYLFDTAHFFHSWYSELPKDLGFLNSFFIREAMYWKDLSETNDLHEYYKYGALDAWGTGNAFLAMLSEAPKWAVNNYLLEFPLVFPCHLSEMTGLKRDFGKLKEAEEQEQHKIAEKTASLNRILGIPQGESFNVNSPKQMKQLLKILGCGDLKSADEKNLNKAAYRHPFNKRIVNLIVSIRKARKLVSTYLTEGKEFNGRILYGLHPGGTDSSRLASREHHFWCGLNIQNQPRGPEVKQTYIADEGFRFAECDLEQAESRDTAYISGDKTLIHNVEYSPDFHCANASAFFGIPFEELFDAATGKKLNKAIRDLAKRVNHGANYNMGPYVLIDTMGEENIFKAKHLLNLPRFWGAVEVATYLLASFHKTYPDIEGVYYKGLVEEVLATSKITSRALHHEWREASSCKELAIDYKNLYVELEKKDKINAWTRYAFGDPTKSKPTLNSYIAHPPQSLNAQTLNKAYLSVFYDIAIHPDHSANFKLCSQIHDSILFQYRVGHEYLCDMVKDRMEIPITIRSYGGEINTFVVPAGVKAGVPGKEYNAKYWSETE